MADEKLNTTPAENSQLSLFDTGPADGSPDVLHIGTFLYHPYIILHFGGEYENEI